MAKKKQNIISNPEIRDSSSKLIFGDRILSSQFFRDYADMEILRNIRPEDIEDVSERYVPLYSTERDSDTVKKVDISRYLDGKKGKNKLNLSLYIISLIEHKTKVEYNVVMQILRYMVYIWEDYEKEMNRKYPGISSRRDFKYPPILPIVYYEGKKKWTAPFDMADKIFCRELLGEYLPHFKYQLVRLHDYSNEELLEKEDEISLAMLINKVQKPEDIRLLSNLPDGQVDKILKDTPEYLLEVMAKIYRGLLYSMGAEEEETEKAVAAIRERKMAKLFENVPKNIEAEKRRTRKQIRLLQKERDAVQEKLNVTQSERDAVKKELNITQSERDAIQEELNNTQNERDAVQEKLNITQKSFTIYKHITNLRMVQKTDSEIITSLMETFSLTKEQAEEEFRKAFER